MVIAFSYAGEGEMRRTVFHVALVAGLLALLQTSSEALRSSRSARRGQAAVCHHIERLTLVKGRR